MNSKKERMWENLKTPDFRKQFIDAHVDEGIAFQIRSLRNKKGKTQPEFAQELGVKQPLVSSWENPAYGNYSLNTLKKLAKAFDVGLLVRFVPFSTLIDWTINLTSDVIAPPSFDEEQDYAYTLKQIEEALKSANDKKNIYTNHTGIPEPIEPELENVPTTALKGVLTNA